MWPRQLQFHERLLNGKWLNSVPRNSSKFSIPRCWAAWAPLSGMSTATAGQRRAAACQFAKSRGCRGQNSFPAVKNTEVVNFWPNSNIPKKARQLRFQLWKNTEVVNFWPLVTSQRFQTTANSEISKKIRTRCAENFTSPALFTFLWRAPPARKKPQFIGLLSLQIGHVAVAAPAGSLRTHSASCCVQTTPIRVPLARVASWTQWEKRLRGKRLRRHWAVKTVPDLPEPLRLLCVCVASKTSYRIIILE